MSRRRTAPLAIVVAMAAIPLLGVAAGAPAQGSADLVLWHGKVATVDAGFTMAEAVAVRGYEVLAVGTDAEIEPLIGERTEVVDLAGRLAIPAFIEGHGHFSGLGRAQMILDLSTVRSWNDIVAMVETAARNAQPGEWIHGRGWHQEKWDEVPQPNVDGVPLHHGLSEVSPENPVLLGHASGHAAFANELALELAGIDRDTEDPEGGTIVRDSSGGATGLLRETAQRLVSAAASRSESTTTADDRQTTFLREVELAGEEALRNGVATFHDAGASFATIDAYRALAEAGALPIRLYVMVRRESNDTLAAKLADYRIIPEGNDFLAVRSIKRQIDGALGSHGAWLLEPYEDLDSTGLVLESVEDITRTAEIAVQAGFQVNTHAIGDRGNREVLDLYEKVFREAGVDGNDLRWRVEHAQHLHPADIGRFAQLGVIAAMQGIHCTSDAPWVYRRLGAERAESGAYMWRALIDSGAVIGNGTDVPVEHIDPIASYYASVVRRDLNGELFFPEQRMTREEALRSYTINNAYAAFEEHLKGSLEPGKLADIVVLSADILTVPDEKIRDAQVDMTFVGGELRYRREGSSN